MAASSAAAAVSAEAVVGMHLGAAAAMACAAVVTGMLRGAAVEASTAAAAAAAEAVALVVAVAAVAAAAEAAAAGVADKLPVAEVVECVVGRRREVAWEDMYTVPLCWAGVTDTAMPEGLARKRSEDPVALVREAEVVDPDLHWLEQGHDEGQACL